MKKKIKDLTEEERDKFCDKYLFHHCQDCPLEHYGECVYDLMRDEVEVDE